MIQKKILYAFMSILCLFLPHISLAETRIHLSDRQKDWVWNKEGSPYILDERIQIPPGYSLTINPGVEVSTPINEYSNGVGGLWSEGDIFFNGTEKEPIKFSLYGNFSIINTNAAIKHTIFSSTTLVISKSTTTIENSTIGGRPTGIYINKSRVSIATSTISNYGNYGIYISRDYRLPILYDTSDPKALYVEDRLESIISIHGSRIITIPNAVLIYNDSPNIINAQNNWWGDETGPKFISGRGKVLTEPFLIEDPDKKEVCCSNVLFIPGFEGSRLYKDNSLIGTNTLWEPNRNEDVKKLFMDSLGNSIDKEIYTKDIISTALGVKAIYKAFINSMDGLVEEGKINSWLPLPYDWRKSIDDLSDADMLKAVTDLAADSKTGRIIIIAHSNGGLVAKRLMQKIEANNGMDVVERIINVAVPELGTPEAILSMLHGYNQEMGWGAVMSENIARTLSQNLPGAYGLLPSKKFFDRNPFTVISDLFSASTLISSFDMMKKFLLTSGFGVDSSTNTTLPLHLNSVLIDSADSSHTTIDDWKPASSTKTLSIFGWGLATSRGIEYHRDPHCLENQVCEPEFVASTTASGDGTVLTLANSDNADSTLFFNLRQEASDSSEEISHANILESLHLLGYLRDHITNTVSTTSPYQKYFTTTEPVDEDTMLTIQIHSPVDINIYDNNGNHIGPPPKQDKEIYIPDEKSKIPGGYYRDFGKVKVAKVPYSSNYEITLTGNDTGLFIVDATLSKKDSIISKINFGELPVTPLMNIELKVGSTTTSFASSTVMNIDVDGDRILDMIAHTNEFLHSTSIDLIAYIEVIRKTILILQLPPLSEKDWLKRIDSIVASVEKGNHVKTEILTKKFLTEKLKDRNITEIQKTIILKTFENLLTMLEQKSTK